ncbi:MAG: 5-histidylcysteine sulfoxide synthase [Planctomycetaceae bacterium]
MASADTTSPAPRPFAALAEPLVPTTTLRLSGIGEGDDRAAATRAALRRYYHATSALYDTLFDLIRDDGAYYERWESLRHPLIFYFAHPAVFYVNKLVAGRLIHRRLDSRLEAMMAVGVDEMSWDDLDTSHYDWPSVDAVRDYRRRLRGVVDEFITSMPLPLPIRQDSPAWIVLMGIEHERIHLETSSVIMRQMPLSHLRRPDELSEAEARLWRSCPTAGPTPANPWIDFGARTVRLGKPATDDTYGWDNEYGSEQVSLPPFRAARQLVSNGEFLRFVEAGGYRNANWWTDEGRGWLGFTRAEHPKFWIRDGRGYRQRNLLDEIPLPLDWPVEVNCLEAEAWCAWQREVTGDNVQLPTEAHWHALREAVALPDPPDWRSAPGNINLERFAGSCPVTMFPQGAPVSAAEGADGSATTFCDVVGNVWQWTRTPIMPFKGFAVHPLYDDFSVPTFDGRHNLMKGGSWISTGNEAIASARYAFRRHFFQHAGFRPIVDAPDHDALSTGARLYETDALVTQYLDFHYGPTALGVANYPVACVAAVLPHVPLDRRRRCLDIGCSVGRSAFEFAREFAHVDAIDFSARFIQVGVRLQGGDEIHYEVPTEGELTTPRRVSLDSLGLDRGPGAGGRAGRIAFMQGDACNLKPLYTGYDVVFGGNLLDRLYDPARFLDGIADRLVPGGILALASPYTWLEEYTPKAKWIGGRREHGEPLTTFAGLSAALAGRFDMLHRGDIPFVIRETARKHQHSIAELTVWKRRD